MVDDRWANKTGPTDGLGGAEGLMVYVPKGDTEMLVHLGGVLVPAGGDPTSRIPNPMERIEIYDLNQGLRNSLDDI